MGRPSHHCSEQALAVNRKAVVHNGQSVKMCGVNEQRNHQ